jgi:hypothetical protein
MDPFRLLYTDAHHSVLRFLLHQSIRDAITLASVSRSWFAAVRSLRPRVRGSVVRYGVQPDHMWERLFHTKLVLPSVARLTISGQNGREIAESQSVFALGHRHFTQLEFFSGHVLLGPSCVYPLATAKPMERLEEMDIRFQLDPEFTRECDRLVALEPQSDDWMDLQNMEQELLYKQEIMLTKLVWPHLTQWFAWLVTYAPHLQRLTLDFSAAFPHFMMGPPPEVLTPLLNLVSLQTFSCFGGAQSAQWPRDSLSVLSRFPSVTHIRLPADGGIVTTHELEAWSESPLRHRLQRIHVEGVDARCDPFLGQMTGLTHLRARIHMRNPHAFATLTNLVSLEIGCYDGYAIETSTLFRSVSHCVQLRSLTLEDLHVRVAHLQFLGPYLPKLETLSCIGLVGMENFTWLSAMPQLTSLSMENSGCPSLPPRSMESILCMPRLQKLNLIRSIVVKEEYQAQCKRLEHFLYVAH